MGWDDSVQWSPSPLAALIRLAVAEGWTLREFTDVMYYLAEKEGDHE